MLIYHLYFFLFLFAEICNTPAECESNVVQERPVQTRKNVVFKGLFFLDDISSQNIASLFNTTIEEYLSRVSYVS